ncbi:hypothetical protein [Escherichia coli]|nr:hypothetical protein [Escherichia coli]
MSKTWHHHGEHCAQLADYLRVAGRWRTVDWRVLSHTPADIAR